MGKIVISKLGWVLSIFFMLGYCLDFFWTYILAGEQQELYLQFMRIVYLKFVGLDLASFVLGLVQVFIWGWVFAVVFGWLWNKIAAKS